ncbi:hypothetical protein [Roseovarius sp. 2305UL8-3]|uniref:hypothetical protein n=1 Tax=Roseovarius conchicola TaxID=3121636 RepID=UPI00352932A8
MSDKTTLAQDAKSQIRDISSAAKDRVAAEVGAKADAVRHTAADEVQSAADAAEVAAGQFDSHSLQAQAAHRIADQIEGVATQLRTTDINSLVAQTSDFARRNPLLFIGGAAALGFAATRFLKARDPHPSTSFDHDDPWGSPQSHAVLADINGGRQHG